jgi:general secretion pathway protein J
MGTNVTRRSTAGQTGMTLIEIMVAVGVLSMISVTIWSATSQTSRTRTVVIDSHERLHQIRVAFDFLTRDLQSTFLSQHRAPMEPTHDTIFIGEDHGSEDRVDFASFSHQRRYFNAKESDQCEIGYFVEEDPDNPEQKNLIRREAPLLDPEPLEGGQYLVLIQDIAEFNLEYYDLPMEEWQDEWDTTSATGEVGLLPHFIRIRIVSHNRRGEEVSFGTQIQVPMRTAIWRQPFIPGPPMAVTK